MRKHTDQAVSTRLVSYEYGIVTKQNNEEEITEAFSQSPDRYQQKIFLEERTEFPPTNHCEKLSPQRATKGLLYL